MNSVKEAIATAEKLLPGIPSPEGHLDPRWQAIIEVGEYIETDPQDVWLFIRKWGMSPSKDVRMAIATVLLEALLGYNFKGYFPLVREACRKSKRFATMFESAWKLGQADLADNSAAFDDLKNKISLANRIWFLVDVVEIAEFPEKSNTNPNRRCLTWVNTLLIRAYTSEQAYEKALATAKKKYPQTYTNSNGDRVQWVVLGLSSMREIQEELKDGIEIDWVNRGHISFKHAQSLVKTKEQLLSEHNSGE